ncbi:transcriptional regulator [Amylibacter kogurei]|uniref:Transcriptional regulator n=1 Tax=Paramylibacter kogurei TaxID=1889778 RepID=A0A2G5K657_9RHOB|nr:transcriptional regulator [Amylibacter kogurei]
MSDTSDLVAQTAQIVSSFLNSNKVPANELPCLIKSVHQTLEQLAQSATKDRETQSPAVAIEESVTPDHIICLEDGKPFKMLKKHLMAVYGMTPEQYRTKWRLAHDYPMVAPNYAMKRQELAKKSGLGRKRS